MRILFSFEKEKRIKKENFCAKLRFALRYHLTRWCVLAIRVYLSDMLKARGMTSKELCAKVGITEANLSILRSGKASGVRFHTINRICYYLECDVGDIRRFDGRLEEEDEEKE